MSDDVVTVYCLFACYREPGNQLVGVYASRADALQAQYHAEKVLNWGGFTWSIQDREIGAMPGT